jgi:hypothetical protein
MVMAWRGFGICVSAMALYNILNDSRRQQKIDTKTHCQSVAQRRARFEAMPKLAIEEASIDG